MAQPGPTPSDRPVPPPPSPAGAEPARLDDDALVALFNQIRDELVSTLLYVIGNADDAQDAAQEAFLKCWRSRHTMGDVQNVRAWIFRIGLNAAKDHQRSAWKRKSRPLPDDDLMSPARDGPPGESLEDRETVGRLREALTNLRPEEREVFLLRQNGELTYEQIAELRGAPVGTVKTQMRAALQKLRKVLNPGAADDQPGAD
ncbi:RNA polymerase sigma factor [bacterium]|nr:RNA polymerase sigma factor [bacterium]